MASTIDFRHLDEGLGGAKRKRKRQEEEEEEAAAESAAMEAMDTAEETRHASKRAAVAGSAESKPAYGRPTYDGVIAGKVSGRKWKVNKTTRASALKQVGRKSTLEERNREKEVKRAYKERMMELKEQIRTNKVEKRKKIEEKARIKKENELRGQAVQKVTNPKTIKKMSKKQRKLLRPAPN
jgi:rRNA-processing protein CGR1